MGEEEKKPEDKKPEAEGKKEDPAKEEGAKRPDEGKDGGGEGEKKSEGDKAAEKKEEEAPPPPPPPPEEVVMRVYMHCDGCARKVERSLKGFQGVEGVLADSRAHKVVVKGKVAAADPLRVVERVRRKTGRKVELVSPIPEPPKPEEEKKAEEEKPKPEEEKKEEPQVVTVVLKVHMHCEACSLEIKRRISKMKGVQAVDTDLKSSEVTVKGVLDPAKLGHYIYRRTGKHAVIVRQEPEKKPEDGGEGGGEEKKDAASGGGEGEKTKEGEDGKEEKKEGGEAGKEGGGGGGGGAEGEGKTQQEEDNAMVEVMELRLRNDLLHYYYPRYNAEYHFYTPPAPQFFSDENPNACAIM